MEFIELFFDGSVEQLTYRLRGIGSQEIVAVVVGLDAFRAYSSGPFSRDDRQISGGEFVGLHHVAGNGFGSTEVHFQPVVERLNEPSHLGIIELFLLCLTHAWKLSGKGRTINGFGRRRQTHEPGALSHAS